MKAKANAVRALLSREISVGDGREKVAHILDDAGIAFGFDKFQNRFQATVFDAACGQYEAASIYILLDAFGNVSKVEVFESFTAP